MKIEAGAVAETVEYFKAVEKQKGVAREGEAFFQSQNYENQSSKFTKGFWKRKEW